MEVINFILERIREKGEYENPAVSFVDSSLLDSFDFITLLANIEEHFGCSLDLSEYDPEFFTTGNGLATIAEEARKKQCAS